MWLRSHVVVAVVQAEAAALILPLVLGTSICHRCGPKKKEKEKKRKNKFIE